jgi:hypothetical protein
MSNEFVPPTTTCGHCNSTNIWWSDKLGEFGSLVSTAVCRDCDYETTFDEDDLLKSCTYDTMTDEELDELFSLLTEDTETTTNLMEPVTP